MLEGPTSGITRMSFSWACQTYSLPGSATPGQPASDIKPTSLCSANRDSIIGTFATGSCLSSSTKIRSWMGLGCFVALTKRRQVLAFSTINTSKRCITSMVCVGRLRTVSSASGVGIKYKVFFNASSSIFVLLQCK